MARGFLSGAIVGAIVGVGAVGVASIAANAPAAPDLAVAAPVAGDAPREGTAVAAQGVSDADLAVDAGGVQVSEPVLDDVASLADAGSDSLGRPSTGGTSGLQAPEAPSVEAGISVDPDAPVLPSPQAALPAQPAAETELSISTEPAQPPAPPVEEQSAFAPIPEDVAEPAPAASGEGAPQEGAPAEAVVAEPEDAIVAPPVPRIQQRAGSLIDRDDAPQEAEAAPVPTARAIDTYGAEFTAPEGKPLMSIVLIDTGEDLSGGAVGVAALRSFPYPLSFAIDATLPDAAERAAAFRAEGLEVLALLDLPTGATPTDAEVNVAAALAAVPEAVGLLEGTGAGVQADRATSDQVTRILNSSGHGVVLQSKGLNTAQKLAVKNGVPAATVFRDFDSADQTPTVIRRFLDQAAFRADQEGGVIMLGRVRPDTISALLLWGLQNRAERVTLAPVSALLKAQVQE